MKTFIKTLAAASLALGGVLSTAPAHAGAYLNGLSLNGLFANGLFANGLFANGLFANGLFANGLTVNGTTEAGKVIAVTLPETESIAAR